jgi:hypothetical protein
VRVRGKGHQNLCFHYDGIHRSHGHLDFALSGGDASDAPALHAHFRAIREALSRKGTFYSSFYSRKGDFAGDIDFFLVDLKGGRLYTINHNT